MTTLIFTQPHLINADLAARCGEGVVVLDIAFNAGRHDPAKEFNDTTKAFIEALGSRLVAWVDHHDHTAWKDYADDPRFVLVPRAQAPACPPILTRELVLKLSPTTDANVPNYDTIVCHGDFDGIMSAAVYRLDGQEPYEGAIADAIAADTRIGTLSERGQLIERALKSDPTDDAMRETIFDYLFYLFHDANPTGFVKEYEDRIHAAVQRYEERERATKELASSFVLNGNVAIVDATGQEERFDRTALLLAGQKLAPVAIVKYVSLHNGEELITIGAPRPWNFIEMLGLSGGMPNVVTVPASRLDETMNLINSK